MQLNESTKKKLKSCLTITEMEELAKGRILSKFIPEVVNSREASKLKKSETLLQTTTTWNFLKMNRAVVGLILRLLKEEHAMVFEESKMFIDPCHEFLCSVPDGNFIYHFSHEFILDTCFFLQLKRYPKMVQLYFW